MRYAVLLLLLVLTACSRATLPEYEVYGEAFGTPSAVPVDVVLAERDLYSGKEVAVSGTVHAVCQNMGCWLMLRSLEGEGMRVDVPRTESGEYVYTVPTDLSGRRALVKGVLADSEVDSKMHHHYEEDAGGTMESTQLTMVASGVMIALL